MNLSIACWKRSVRFSSGFSNTNVLRRPHFDMKGVIENAELYRRSLRLRQEPQQTFDNLSYIVENRQSELELSKLVDRLRHARTKLSQEMRASQTPELKSKLVEIKNEIKQRESDLQKISKKLFECMDSLPNLLDDGVPGENEKAVARFINCKSEEDALTKLPRMTVDHKDIGEKLELFNFNVASKVSGSSWYYLIGDGALLEQALIQYGLSKARLKGYQMIAPPSIVKSEVINACGFKPKDQNNEQQIYEIANTELALTGTAEIPLGALHSSTTFPVNEIFPKKYVGVSRSYRAEAGARGRDTKGLYRVHEFTKIELFHFTKPAESSVELEQIRQFQEEIIDELGLVAKFMDMPASDLGAPAVRKYDCEAWMPGRGAWGELTSTSNCTDYQSRRLGIKYDDKVEKSQYVHTLNGTCLAIPRVIVAIIEQFYDTASDSITIPHVLRKYMDGKSRITK